MNLGKLKLNGNLVLAPMSGVTNLPLRILCKKYGVSLVYSEMISSEAIVRERLNGAVDIDSIMKVMEDAKAGTFQAVC